MSRIGASKDTTVVFYGDKNNWWACYAFWVFQLFGHDNARVMDGGRKKWEKEKPAGEPQTSPALPTTSYKADGTMPTRTRAFRDEVLAHIAGRPPARRCPQPG